MLLQFVQSICAYRQPIRNLFPGRREQKFSASQHGICLRCFPRLMFESPSCCHPLFGISLIPSKIKFDIQRVTHGSKYPPHAQIAGSWFRLETLRVHSVLYLLYVSYTLIIYSHVVCVDTWLYVQCFWKESMLHSVPILADTLEYTLMVIWERSRISGAHCISQPLGRHLSAPMSSADRNRL